MFTIKSELGYGLYHNYQNRDLLTSVVENQSVLRKFYTQNLSFVSVPGGFEVNLKSNAVNKEALNELRKVIRC
jgi:hypothetical protein